MDGSRLTTTEVALNLAGISKSYGSVQALKPMSLEIKDGEMLALLGPSGCGKTTTLRLIAGFEAPDTGSILINGKDVTDLPPNKRALGMVFQNYSLFPHMTVGENVAFGLKVRGASKADRAARVRAMLEMVRLDKHADRQIRHFRQCEGIGWPIAVRGLPLLVFILVAALEGDVVKLALLGRVAPDARLDAGKPEICHRLLVGRLAGVCFVCVGGDVSCGFRHGFLRLRLCA